MIVSVEELSMVSSQNPNHQTEEKELGSFLKHCAKVGYENTIKDIFCIVESATNERGLLCSSNISDGLLWCFKERHGDLSLKQGDSMAHVTT